MLTHSAEAPPTATATESSLSPLQLIGQAVRRSRQARNLSIPHVAMALKLPSTLVQALEQGRPNPAMSVDALIRILDHLELDLSVQGRG